MNVTTVKIVTKAIALVALTSFAPDAVAKQFKQNIQGKEVVVHTNPIPVILHRMVPPQHGRHVTQKEVATGTLPSPQPGLLNLSSRKK